MHRFCSICKCGESASITAAAKVSAKVRARAERASVSSSGLLRKRALSSSGISGFGIGSTHCGVRWKSVSSETRSAIAPTTWIALEPVPMTPTRWPSTGTE